MLKAFKEFWRGATKVGSNAVKVTDIGGDVIVVNLERLKLASNNRYEAEKKVADAKQQAYILEMANELTSNIQEANSDALNLLGKSGKDLTKAIFENAIKNKPKPKPEEAIADNVDNANDIDDDLARALEEAENLNLNRNV